MKFKIGKRSTVSILFAVIISAAMILTDCGKKESPVILDIDATAKAIHDGVVFEDELEKLDRDAVKYLYGIDESIAAAVYVGSGATAEEIAVFDAGTDEGGKAMHSAVQNHVTEQIESYRNYVPAELARLEDAVIVTHGRYVMLCVTADSDTARGIMEEAIGS